MFQNQLDIFEHQLIMQYFQYSERVLCLYSPYTDWAVDFKRRHHQLMNIHSRSLVVAYIEYLESDYYESGRKRKVILSLTIFIFCEKFKIKYIKRL